MMGESPSSRNNLNCRSRKIQGAILMKKILVTVVLGVAALVAAQIAAQPAQGQASTTPAPAAQPAQPAAPAAPAQGPVIKDPNEYNAYIGATGQKDPAAEISGLEAFVT